MITLFTKLLAAITVILTHVGYLTGNWYTTQDKTVSGYQHCEETRARFTMWYSQHPYFRKKTPPLCPSIYLVAPWMVIMAVTWIFTVALAAVGLALRQAETFPRIVQHPNIYTR